MERSAREEEEPPSQKAKGKGRQSGLKGKSAKESQEQYVRRSARYFQRNWRHLNAVKWTYTAKMGYERAEDRWEAKQAFKLRPVASQWQCLNSDSEQSEGNPRPEGVIVEDRLGWKIFVFDIPLWVEYEDLERLFWTYGKVIYITMMRKRRDDLGFNDQQCAIIYYDEEWEA